MFARRFQAVTRFLTRDAGSTAVEYAVILALILTVCLASLLALSPAAGTTFGGTTAAVGTHGVE